MVTAKYEVGGWFFFKVYHTRRKGPSPYYNPFLPNILIAIKNESKVVKNFRSIIFLWCIPKLLNGLKGESKLKITKEQKAKAHSLTCSILGVEGRVGALGWD